MPDPVKSAEETTRQLEDAIKNAKPASPEELTKAIEKMNAKMDSVPKSELEKEIIDLVENTLAVDKAFLNVQSSLSNLVEFSDIKEITPAVKEEIVGLLTDWKKYRTHYVNLLWDSREVAGNASAAADDFANVFVQTYFGEGAEDIPIQEIKSAIADSIEKIDKDKLASASLSQSFLDLKADVTNFQDRWAIVVKKFKLKYGSERVRVLERQIENVEASLASMNRKVIIYSTAVGVLGTAAIGLAVYGFFAPVALLGALAAAMGGLAAGALLAKALTDQGALLRELSDKKQELAEVQGTKEIMEKLEAALASSEDDFQLICEKLGSLGSVWAGIRTELQSIQKKLDIAMGPSDKRIFQVRMKNNISLYNAIGKTLKTYQNTVTPDRLPPKNNLAPRGDVFAVARARQGVTRDIAARGRS